MGGIDELVGILGKLWTILADETTCLVVLGRKGGESVDTKVLGKESRATQPPVKKRVERKGFGECQQAAYFLQTS